MGKTKLTTIIINKKQYKDTWTQDFVDGVIYILERYDYENDDIDSKITIRGCCDINYDTVERFGLGSTRWDGMPDTELDDIKDNDSLIQYITDFTELEYEKDDINKYVTNVYFKRLESGGFERDVSYCDLVHFDNIDFYKGMEQCIEWLNLPVRLDNVLDTQDYSDINVD